MNRPHSSWSRTLLSLFLSFDLFWSVGRSCTRIVVDSSEAGDNLNWIDGIFDMDRNARIDDRLVYKEVNGTRIIYHYSGSTKEREIGRWLLGSSETMNTDNGWAYRSSWSISPDDSNINALQNNDQTEFPWKVYEEEEWIDTEGLKFYCESAFGNHEPMNDFLFVTTNDTFEDNGLTYQSIHGFYVRISEDTFTKISGSKRVFYQEKGNASEIFVVGDNSKIQPNGLPVLPIPTTKLSRPSLNATWRLHGSDGKVIDHLHIVALQVQDNAEEDDEEEQETIYDLVRRYYRELKAEFIEEKEVEIAELNNGMVYPMIGLGTGGITGATQNSQIIKEAITKHDYIAIDSASHYESEAAIGALLKEDASLRSRLFLTSKIWPTDLYFQATLDSVQKTLTAMRVNYVDMYMIYWPACYDHLKFVDCSHSKDGKWQQSYEALSKLYAEGTILNIGVSNWDEELMNQLLQGFPIKPQVVQNQMDLKTMNWEFKDYVNELEILLQAYSPFRGLVAGEDTEYREWKKILSDMCDDIEQDQEVKISPSQLALRFLYENGIAVIPRSSKSQHLKENNDIFAFEFTNDHNVGLGGRDVEKEEL